ncbi:MAG: relaxase/mobilization nuclease domain-containing protein [Clostridiales bacterium]|nr:relaxase/mobilization nuclease domain-containing protein [Clostridiales bacterium]
MGIIALTKLMHMKQSAKGNPAAHLKNGIQYIMQKEKTDGGIWIGGNAGTAPDEVLQTFLDTKKDYGKPDGRQGYHFVISFKEDAAPEQVYQIMGEFCKEYLGDQYDFVYAVHTDTSHPHAHVIFNSVARTTGIKYHYKKGDWEKYIQRVTDQICQKYGFDKFEYEGGEQKDYGEWLRERQGKLTWRDVVKNDLDYLIPKVETYQELLIALSVKGYRIRAGKSVRHGEYLAFTPKDGKKAVRSYQLGKGYQPEDLKNRIQNRDKMDTVRPDKALVTPRLKKVRSTGYLARKQEYLTPYQFYYVKRYCKNSVLYHYQNTRNYKDIRDTEKAARQCRYLLRHCIRSETELKAREQLLEEKRAGFLLERNRLYRNGISGEEKQILNKYQALQKKQKEAAGDEETWESCQDELEKLEESYYADRLSLLQEEREKRIQKINEDIRAIKAEAGIIRQFHNPQKNQIKREQEPWKNIPIQPRK